MFDSTPVGGDVYVPNSDGRFVSQKFQDLAEVIKDYDQWLELRYIPPDKRRDQKDRLEAYAIVDTHPTVNNKPILFASETDTPEDILARLLMGDTHKGNPLTKIDAMIDARKLLETKRWMKSLEEASDQAKHMMQSPLNYITHKTAQGERIKLDDQRRRLLP